MKRLVKIFLTTALCLIANFAFAQNTITGKVYDNNRQPLMGASVRIDSTSIMTLTKTDGSYTLDIPQEYEHNAVIIQYSGYQDKIIDPNYDNTDVVFEPVRIKVIDDIVISTQKRLQSSIEVPIAVTAFDQQRLDELNATQIDEISGYVAGFTNIIQGQNKAGYSIRGVTSDGMESFFQPRISVFFNGVSVSREQTSALEPFDLERIEVVKGPQGTLFGRGAEIGAVHFISKRPEKDLSAYLKLNVGLYGQRGAQGFVNTPFNENVANRFAFSYDYHDGYINNLAGGRLNGKNTYSFRNTLSISKKERNTFNIILDYLYDKDPGVSFKSKKIAPEGGTTSPFSEAYLEGKHPLGLVRHLGGLTLDYNHVINSNLNITNTFGVRGVYADEYFDGDGSQLYIIDAREMAKQYQLSEEFRLNWTKGDRLSGFFGAGAMYEYCEHTMNIWSDLTVMFPNCVGTSMKEQLAGLPTSVSDGVKDGIESFKQQLLSQYPPEYADMLTQALDGYSNAVYEPIKNAMSAHLEAWNQWMDNEQWEQTPDFFGTTKTTVNGILVNALNQLLAANPQASALLNGASAEQVVAGLPIEQGLKAAGLDQISNATMTKDYEEHHINRTFIYETDVFADVTCNVVQNFYLTLGLRGTYEKQKTGYSSTSMPAPIGGHMIYKSTNGETYWIEGDDLSWVGRLVANYMITPTNNIYLSFAKGRRPSVVFFNYDPDEPLALQAESIFNYEVGAKGNVFKNHLAYALAVYRYDWLHFQSSIAYTDEGGQTRYRTSDKGRARSTGVELSLKYYCKRFVTFFGDYSFCDGKFLDEDEDGNNQEYSGNSFRLSSKHSFDFGCDVEIPMRNKFLLYIRPSISYKSKLYFEDNDREDLSQDEFSIVNATAGVKFTKGRLSYDLGFWGKNLMNTEYLIDAGNAGDAIGLPTFVAGAPATFGIRASVLFK